MRRRFNLATAVQNSGIFDLEYYRDQAEDCPPAEKDAIRHYLEVGRTRGLIPSPRFDESYYLRNNLDLQMSGHDALTHYIQHGQFEDRPGNAPEMLNLINQIEASGLFDAAYYSAKAGLKIHNPTRAIVHYLEREAVRRVSPSPRFDRQYYLAKYPDVALLGVDPFLHYILDGKAEGRHGELPSNARLARPKIPDLAVWQELSKQLKPAKVVRSHDRPDMVDIVVPVCGAGMETLACLHAVLTAPNNIAFRLIVICDTSLDLELAERLREMADLNLITLIENQESMGFGEIVYHSLHLDGTRDVVLLDAGVVVYGNWLDRMRSCAYSSDRIATVTPFSNSMPMLSYPHANWTNNQILEIPPNELDQIFARVNDGCSTTVPIRAPFCLYVRRTAIKAVCVPRHEVLDGNGTATIDVCLRSSVAGLENAAALDVYVRHVDEVAAFERMDETFRRTALDSGNGVPVLEPDTLSILRQARSNIDVERFANLSGRQSVFMIEHGWGGGVKRHVDDLSGFLLSEGIDTIVATPSTVRNSFTLSVAHNDNFPNMPNIDWTDFGAAISVLTKLRVGLIHVHSLVGFDKPLTDTILDVIERSGIACCFTIHDYSPVCPRITMIDWGGSYCNSPSVEYCGRCIERTSTPFGDVNIKEWRARYRRLLELADTVIVPHIDVAARTRDKLVIDKPMLVRPHPVNFKSAIQIPSRAHACRTIGVIGSIGPHKGARTLEALCVDAIERKLDLKFIVYGNTDFNDRASALPNLRIKGKYHESRIGEILAEDPCHILLFPSVWPETFCYTLDLAFEAGIFPLAFDLGAPARRIQARNFGAVMPLNSIYNPSYINDYVLSLKLPEVNKPMYEVGRDWISAAQYYGFDVGARRS